MPHKRNQKGFAVVESLLIVVIIGLLAGVGYYVWHSNRQTTAILNAANQSAQSTAAKVDQTTAVSLALDKTELPAGWSSQSDTASSVMVGAGDKSCFAQAVLIAVDAAKSPDTAAFVHQQLAATLQASKSKGYSASQLPTSTMTVNTSKGKKSLTSYPIGLTIAGYTTNQHLGFLVAGKSYVGLTESCINTNDFSQADKALLAITIKEQ